MKKLTGAFFSFLLFLALCIPVCAAADGMQAAQLDCVTDAAGILTNEQWQTLEEEAETVSAQHACAVYIITVDDYTTYGDGSIYDVSKAIYQEYELGWGEEKSGVLLLLSMAERDYALIAYGYGNTAFTDYGKDKLSEDFLDDFGDDDWAGGFSDYVEKSEELLALARSGAALDKNSNPTVKYGGIAISVFLACVLAFVVCIILKANMKSVEEKTEANVYLSKDSVQFTAREDHFTHATEIRTERSRESSSDGGTSVDSDGFSGQSGKF